MGLVLLVALGIAGWQFGWWLEEKNVDRQVRIDNRQKGTQTAWHDEVVEGIRDYRLLEPSDTARRGAVRNSTCDLIGRLTPQYLDANIVTFQETECR